MHRLYDDLAAWWPLLSPLDDYEEEAMAFAALLQQAAGGPIGSLLELGVGAGSIAAQLPAPWALTLVDQSQPMLDLCAARIPRATCLTGDMRSLRLGTTFDAALLYDAVMYLRTEEELAATYATLATHVRPGGAVLVAPDVTTESFYETTDTGGAQDGDRAAQLLEWRWDPDPTDTHFRAELVLVLREEGQVRTVHETHEMGLFSRATHTRLLRAAGLEMMEPQLPPGMALGEVFLARKPTVGAAR